MKWSSVADKTEKRPMIAIVIDDMGVDRKRSERAARLPAAVTLSYMSYARDVQAQADAARLQGHQIFEHVPMQPDSTTVNPGPDYLRIDQDAATLHTNLVKNLDAFQGYVGINNHMGSKFTQDAAGMKIVAQELKKRRLMFLDSVTDPASVAEHVAASEGVLSSHRDIFIDHFETAAAVKKYLSQIEKTARRQGSVIAIGHPKDVTLSALEAWLPTLHGKGFRLVPLSLVIHARQAAPTQMPAGLASEEHSIAVQQQASILSPPQQTAPDNKPAN